MTFTHTNSDLTIVMYHYIKDRDKTEGLNCLLTEDFGNQLDLLSTQYNFIDPGLLQLAPISELRDQLPPRAAMLTFDDGYIDHYERALPMLVDRGLIGAFFVPTGVLLDHKPLDVNKIHFILAGLSDLAPVAAAIDVVAEEAGISPGELRAKHWVPNRFDTAGVNYVKRALQTALPRRERRELVDRLFRQYVTNDLEDFVASQYLSLQQIKEMHGAGMLIGSHGHAHDWLANLDVAAQRADIERSLELFDLIAIERDGFGFCYPYGSYNSVTSAILATLGCSFAVTTEVRVADLGSDPLLALPRLDTNDFPVAP